MWTQFRRLLLGTMVEALLDKGWNVDFPTLRIRFDDDSEFRVPRLNNYMRFKGTLEARVSSPPSQEQVDELSRTLSQAWPALLKVLDIPIGDRLTLSRNDLQVQHTPDDRIVVRFDLEAD